MNMLNLTCPLDDLQLETEDTFLKLSQNVNHFSENKTLRQLDWQNLVHVTETQIGTIVENREGTIISYLVLPKSYFVFKRGVKSG